MKRTRGEKERWEDFEARVGIKRSSGGKKETHKAAPNEISVTIELVHMYLLLIRKRNEGPKRIKRISISLVKQISFTRHPPDLRILLYMLVI